MVDKHLYIKDVVTGEDFIDIFKIYSEIIAPMIIQLEAEEEAFPIEILNEIRAVFTHLSRSVLSGDINSKEYQDNIKGTERHIKRAVLDCFKYMCMSYDDKYKAFEERYKNVDLMVIDNGKFLPELSKKRETTVDLFYYAKTLEVKHFELDVVLDAFQNAYNSYIDVDKFIKEHYDSLHIAESRFLKNNVFAISGWALSAIGVILAVIFFVVG